MREEDRIYLETLLRRDGFQRDLRLCQSFMQKVSEMALAVPTLPVGHAGLAAVKRKGLNDRQQRSAAAALGSLEDSRAPADRAHYLSHNKL